MNLRPRFLPLLLLGVTALLATSPRAAASPLKLTPFRANGIYTLGETVGWTVVRETTAATSVGPAKYVIRENNLVVLKTGTIDPSQGSATIQIVPPKPAMLYVEVQAGPPGAAPIAAGAVVSPAQLQPSVPCPSDFDEFWQSKIARLHQVPLGAELTPGPGDQPGVEYAIVRLNNLNGAHVYGQLAKPARPGRFPAILVLQWANPPYPLHPSWVTDLAAKGWLALNVEPHDVPCNLSPAFYEALPELIKNYRTIYDDDRDRNYFLQMYLGDYRALDYLASRPDWDGRTLVVTGTSMGGQQSLCIAGLHPKVTHLLVHVPAGADADGPLHGRASGYPNWDSTRSRVMQTGLYFDTVNFAPRIKATCLLSVGFIDTTVSPVGIWIEYNAIRAPKEIVPLVDAPHNNLATPEQQRAYFERADAWLAALVRGEQPEVRHLTTNVPAAGAP